MRLLKTWKRALAITCAVAMTVTSIQVTPIVSRAATGDSTTFAVLSTTDVHGKVWGTNLLNSTSVNNSLLNASTAIKGIRDTYGAENVVLIDNGDTYQGTPVSSYNILNAKSDFDGATPMAIAMKYLDYDAVVLGNHEFNYPWATMQKVYSYLESEAGGANKVPVLAANLVYEQTKDGHTAGDNVFTPYVIKEISVGGSTFKIGILGLENTDCTRWDVPDNYPNIRFAGLDNANFDMAVEAQKYVDQMKAAGCNFIIASYHTGLGSYSASEELQFAVNTENQGLRVIKNTTGIDMLITGHDHSTAYSNADYTNKDGKAVKVVNAGGTDLTKTVFTATKTDTGFSVAVDSSANVTLSGYAKDTALEAMIQPYADAASAYVNQPCGTISGTWDTKINYYLEQTDTMDLINRAQIAMGTEYMKAKYASGEAIDINALQAKYGADYTLDVDLSSTSVVVDSNYTVKAGALSIKDIYKFYKYDNSLYVLPISGKQIKTALEFLADKKYTATPKNGAIVYKGGDFTTPVFYGLDFFYDLAKPVGERVIITGFKNGKPFNENQMYNIAINNYHLGNAEGPFGAYTTTDALWSQNDDLGGGTVQDLIADYVEAAGATGVAPDRSTWYLTWSGEIPKEEVVTKKPAQIYDPISDTVFSGEYADAVTVKDAPDRTGTGTVIGQIVYTYTDGVIIEDVIGGNLYGYLLYTKGAGNTYNVGDVVAATGTFYNYYGLPEMSPTTSIKVIESQGAKFAIAPEVMSPGDVTQADINKYVIFKDVSASTTQMTDSKGSIPALGITSLPDGVSEGSKIDAKGVITYDFNNLKLRSANASISAHVANYDPITETFDAGVLNISEAVAKTSGTITVMGQVAYIYGGYNNAAIDNGSGLYNVSAILQDVVDGKVVSIQIYDKRVQTGLTEAQKLHVGDVVKVTGTRADYGSTIKVAQVTVDSAGTIERVKTEVAFQPETITLSQITDYLNRYVRINGLTFGAYDGTSSAGTPISDATGTSAIYRGAEIPSSVTTAVAADPTKSISIVGVASGYTGTQVRVGSSFDYSVYTAPVDPADSIYTIPVVETSDVHGFILDTSSGVESTYQYRMAYIADAVDKLRSANNGDVLLLDGGDIYQGNPVSNLQAGKAMTAAYDAMGYDAVALGNHEFDWGVTTLIDPDGTMGSYSLANGTIAGDSQIPVLCSNIYYKDSSERVNFTKDYVILDKKAVNAKGQTKDYKVAVFGYADDYSADIMTARIAPYKIVEDDLSKIQAQAKALETAGTVDVSILLVHADSKAIAEKLGTGSAFDLVVGGHTHMNLNGVASNGIAYMQPQNQAKNYAYSELVIDAGNKVSVSNSKNVPVYESATKAKLYDTPANAEHLNADIMKISKAATAEVAPIMNEVLGTIPASVTKTAIGNNPMSSVAGTWMAEYMNAATGAKVSFTNAGGLRTEFLLDSGATSRNLTAGDVYTMAPFDNKLPTFNFTYEELVGLLNYTISDTGKKALDMRMGGATAYYTGSTITALVIDGKLIYKNGEYLVDKNTTVKVCTNEYIATYIGSPFESKTSLEAAAGKEAAIDNVSYIAALKAEGLANNGKLHVTTAPTLVNGEYSATYKIPVVETSDVHGFILDTSSGVESTYQYRMAYIADAVDKLRNANSGDMLLLDGGDIYQGNPVSNLQAGKAMTAAYDAMGYDAVALGNHEFDWGVTTLIDPDGTMGSYSLANGTIKGDSQIPVLCSNIYYKDSSERVNFTKDYVILDKKGVNANGETKDYKVAVFGYADDYSADIMTARIAPYKIVEDDLSKIQAQAKALETAGTVDVSILLVHADSKAIAEKLGTGTAFDLVVGGHTHMNLNGVASNGVAYMQPQNQAKNYAYSELVIDAGNKVSVANSVNVPVYESATKAKLYDTPANAEHLNADIMKISKAATAEVAPIMNEVLGTIPASVTKTAIGNNPMSSVAGTWMAEYMNAATGAKVSFTNAGGLRTEFLLDSGATSRNLTAGDVYTMAPFDNKLPTFNFTYEELVGLLNYTISDTGKKALDMRMGGATAYYTGSTITALVIDGKLIYQNGEYLVDKNTTVKVCTNEYIATFIGSPFEHKTSLEAAAGKEAAIDNVSYIAALKAEGLANNGKLHVTTAPTLVNGEYSDGGSGAPSGGNNGNNGNNGGGNGSTTNPTTPGTPVVIDKAKEVKTEIDAAAPVAAATERDGSFYTAEGKKITNSVVTNADGDRYIVDGDGAKYVASIVSVGSGESYITNSTGEIITGSIVKTNGNIYYTTKGTGKVVTDKLFKLDGNKYYAAASGALSRGAIVKTNDKLYYTTKATGKIVTDKLFKLDGKKYVADKSGSLVASEWVTVDGKKYYCNKNGVVTKTKK